MINSAYVLYSPKTSPSGKALRDSLFSWVETLCENIEIRGGGLVGLSKFVNKRGEYPGAIINFGHTTCLELEEENKLPIILNCSKKILLSSNKRGCRIAFAEKEVPAPKLWLHVDEIEEYPVVARTTTHSKGRGFWYCETYEDALNALNEGATHFLKFISNTREFRVHVIAKELKEERTEEDYLSIKMSEKIKEGVGSDIIKNHDNGYVFKFTQELDKELLGSLRECAKKAVSVFNLEWGAVDIMYCKNTGLVYTLEINSSPCLTDDSSNTIELYSKHILKLLGVISVEEKETLDANRKVVKNLLRRLAI